MLEGKAEEKAEEYVIKKHNIDTEHQPIDFCLGVEFSEDIADFLAGYEQGYEDCRYYAHDYYKPKWHDLRKNPDDLPNPNTAVLICFRFEKWSTTYIAYYRPAMKKWQIYNLLEAQRQPIVDDYIDREEVIAWCELPEFEE